MSHFPPGYIRSGTGIGTGHMDRALDHTQRYLSAFQHDTLTGPLPRALATMKRRDGVCSNGLFKTAEREEFIYFSKPYIWIVANRLIASEAAMPKVLPHLTSEGAVDAKALLKDEAIRYGYQRDRAYAPVIDRALQATSKGPRGSIVIRSETLMKMIAGGRFDVTFAYPAEALHHLRGLGLSPKLRYLPIVDVNPFFPVHVGCSKGALGKRIIDDVNKMIDEAGAYPDWYQYYEKNLTPVTAAELQAFVRKQSN